MKYKGKKEFCGKVNNSIVAIRSYFAERCLLTTLFDGLD